MMTGRAMSRSVSTAMPRGSVTVRASMITWTVSPKR